MIDSPQFSKYAKKHFQSINWPSIKGTFRLYSEGATVPFIARYRKEQTGNLDEVQVRQLMDGFTQFAELEKRKVFILEELEKQNQLTAPLKEQIEEALVSRELEELYRPYKKKRKTKASMARSAGLEPLADWIWEQAQGANSTEDIAVKAKEYINAEKGYVTYQEVLAGAEHIINEKLYLDKALRQLVKDEYNNNAIITSQRTSQFKENSKFTPYADYKEQCKKLLSPRTSHRYLALCRGWQAKELKVAIASEGDAELLKAFQGHVLKNEKASGPVKDLVLSACKTALHTHLIPSVSNELHVFMKEIADQHAVEVFTNNVEKILLSSPFGTKVVLGVDPGLKTGCKVVLVDNSGQFISNTVMSLLHEGDEEKAQKLLKDVCGQVEIEAVALGNGTGSREAEIFLKKALKAIGKEMIPVVIVNESGASVYSASDVAREEFPDLDVTVRGAISIARRLQDPLAELVKIDPKSIGVGQYQHDVSQSLLEKSLNDVVESCVNRVGINLNTASAYLLQYVAGVGPALAKNIVKYRGENGLFKDRSALMNVSRLSSKTFEQAAGFLRIPDGDMLLDRTGIHPEKYSVVQEMAVDCDLNLKQLLEQGVETLKAKKEKWSQLVGDYTFEDILHELKKPGLDPRSTFKPFSFRDDLKELTDLKKDMICPGVVTNVTNFGAFIDVGVHQDGLVHISELSHNFVSDPKTVVSPGDMVQVKVLSVDTDKKQIAFSMLLKEKPAVVTPKSKSKKFASRKEGESSSGGPKRKTQSRRPQKGKGTRKPATGMMKSKKSQTPFNNPFADLKK